MTLRKIASRVGVSHAAPYRHFKDKEALLCAVAREGFDLLMDWTQTRLADVGEDPLLQFGTWGMAYMDFAIAHPAYFRVMFRPSEKNSTQTGDFRPASSAYSREFRRLVKKWHASGVLSATDPAAITRAAWSMVHGFSMLFIENHLETETLDDKAVLQMKRSVLKLLYFGTRPD